MFPERKSGLLNCGEHTSTHWSLLCTSITVSSPFRPNVGPWVLACCDLTINLGTLTTLSLSLCVWCSPSAFLLAWVPPRPPSAARLQPYLGSQFLPTNYRVLPLECANQRFPFWTFTLFRVSSAAYTVLGFFLVFFGTPLMYCTNLLDLPARTMGQYLLHSSKSMGMALHSLPS